ncbi:DUF6357 family protein [Kribbella sp. NPDC056861]|uniref:DUF6357 family protein n=1 Tax=Kribbella sp. NPDC056861 TaxID=3154857 RepID=UPI00343072E8
MSEVVFARENGWFPRVVRDDGVLRIELGAGADANHDPRTFSFPIDETHHAVIRDELKRHLLLWSAILPLCDAAGTRGALDEDAAVTLLDPILFSAPADVEALFQRIRWDRSRLIAHGADIELLDRGQIWGALRSATETADWPRVQKHQADRRRTQRGVTLAPLDAAILKFTGQYLHGATIPKRRPDEVDPALLPAVLRVIATAERASAGMRISRDPRRGVRATSKQDWERLKAAVDAAVRSAYPELVEDAVATVSFLMCSEAAERAKSVPLEDGDEFAGSRSTKLIFTDDKEVAETWSPGGSRSAATEFWEFVGRRSAGDNEVFTIEDEQLGEGLQVHFYADSIARITTVAPGVGGAEPEYRVEYGLVDGLDGYRTLVRAFVSGGCAALDPYGPWMTDVAEFERARRQRDARKS